MSGGAFNYGHYKIEQVQEDILHEIIYERESELELDETETAIVGFLLKRLGETARLTKQVERHVLTWTGFEACLGIEGGL